jgi:hypothetical protein
MPPKRNSLALAVPLALALAGPAAAQQHPAPLYRLPDVGTWVEYEWQGTGPDGEKQSGRLRLSCVGDQEVAGVPHGWVEVRNEQRRGERDEQRLRKLLLPTRAPADGAARAYERRAPGGAVTKLSDEQVREFLALGFAQPPPVLKVVAQEEAVPTKLGRFSARHVTAAGTVNGRKLTYHGWLTERVPFGCARFEMRDETGAVVFRADPVRSGRDARSELDESKVK